MPCRVVYNFLISQLFFTWRFLVKSSYLMEVLRFSYLHKVLQYFHFSSGIFCPSRKIVPCSNSKSFFVLLKWNIPIMFQYSNKLLWDSSVCGWFGNCWRKSIRNIFTSNPLSGVYKVYFVTKFIFYNSPTAYPQIYMLPIPIENEGKIFSNYLPTSLTPMDSSTYEIGPILWRLVSKLFCLRICFWLLLPGSCMLNIVQAISQY